MQWLHRHAYRAFGPVFGYHAPMSATGKLVLIIGPSGVGKSVILKALKRKHPEFVIPKSATTRAQRASESSDLYHFVSDEDFDRWIAQKKFLEWAVVHKGARYGTLLDEIIPPIERGQIVVREVDVQGFLSIRELPQFKGAGAPYRLQTIFILPDSEQQLIGHIKGRAPITDEELARRIASMRKELECAPLTDAQVHNKEGDLDATIAKVESLVLSD
jgi:guanylate kinase